MRTILIAVIISSALMVPVGQVFDSGHPSGGGLPSAAVSDEDGFKITCVSSWYRSPVDVSNGTLSIYSSGNFGITWDDGLTLRTMSSEYAAGIYGVLLNESFYSLSDHYADPYFAEGEAPVSSELTVDGPLGVKTTTFEGHSMEGVMPRSHVLLENAYWILGIPHLFEPLNVSLDIALSSSPDGTCEVQPVLTNHEDFAIYHNASGSPGNFRVVNSNGTTVHMGCSIMVTTWWDMEVLPGESLDFCTSLAALMADWTWDYGNCPDGTYSVTVWISVIPPGEPASNWWYRACTLARIEAGALSTIRFFEGRIEASPIGGDAAMAFEFDASAAVAVDPESDYEYRWDWEDDGVWDTGWSTDTAVTHSFDEPGVYSVRLDVRDSEDNVSTGIVVVQAMTDEDSETDDAGTDDVWLSVALALAVMAAVAVIALVVIRKRPGRDEE